MAPPPRPGGGELPHCSRRRSAARTEAGQWLAWYWYLRGRLGEARRSIAAALAVPGQDSADRAAATVWQVGHDCHRCQGHQPHRGDRAGAGAVRRTGARTVVPDLHSMGVRRPGRADGPDRPSDRDVHRGRRPLGTGRGTEYPGTAQHRARGPRRDAAGRSSQSGAFRRARRRLGPAAGDVLADRCRRDQRRLPDRRALPVQDACSWRRSSGCGPRCSFRTSGLGRIAFLTGDYARADALHERARRLAIEQSNKSAEEYAEVGLGLSARHQGRLDDAEAHLTQVARLAQSGRGYPGDRLHPRPARLRRRTTWRLHESTSSASARVRSSAAGRRRAGDRAGVGGSGRRGRGSRPRPPAARRSRSAPGESGCTTSAGGALRRRPHPRRLQA